MYLLICDLREKRYSEILRFKKYQIILFYIVNYKTIKQKICLINYKYLSILS